MNEFRRKCLGFFGSALARPLLGALAVLTLASSASAARVDINDVIARAKRRNQPSLFRVWNGAITDYPTTKTPDELMAMHDMTVQGPWYFGLQWDIPPGGFEGEAKAFTAASVQIALEKRRQLLAINPNIILIGEIRNYDALVTYLPPDSPDWARGPGGALVPTVQNYFKLNPLDPTFQKHVAAQALALLETGVVDGIFLDWAKDERYGVIKSVRDALGDNAVIIGNVNVTVTPMITPLMNGTFMESITTYFKPLDKFWSDYVKTIDHNHKFGREPKLVGTELWGDKNNTAVKTIDQVSHMRAGFTAVLTHSNGFYAYYPDDNVFFEHYQHWYPFWAAELGQPLGDYRTVDGASVRDFTAGTAVFNPYGNKPVTITLPKPHKSMATGMMGTTFTVPAYDGDIFVNGTPVPSDYPPGFIPGVGVPGSGGAGGGSSTGGGASTGGVPGAGGGSPGAGGAIGVGGSGNGAGADPGGLAGSGITGTAGGGTGGPGLGGSAGAAPGVGTAASGATPSGPSAQFAKADSGCSFGHRASGHSGWLALFALGLLARRRQSQSSSDRA